MKWLELFLKKKSRNIKKGELSGFFDRVWHHILQYSKPNKREMFTGAVGKNDIIFATISNGEIIAFNIKI